eukprot:5741823-Ditylum_brightwellii.AAC.1
MVNIELEKLLYVLEAELLEKVMKDGDTPTTMDATLEDFFTGLQKREQEIVVPTDKSNGHKLFAATDYINWVKKHMRDASIPIKRQEIVKLHHEALQFANWLKEFLNNDEFGYLMENLNSRAIPKPQLLIKDHKKVQKGWSLPNETCHPSYKLCGNFFKDRIHGNQKYI